MDKKPLIVGSICVVVLLVVGSLSNVVGYQSVKSISTVQSPLFNIRTQKAINKESNVLTSNYVGKGLDKISFPLKDNKPALILKIMDRIRTMDDKEFNMFINLVVNPLLKDKKISIDDSKILIKHLYNLRSYQGKINLFNSDINPTPTVDYCPTLEFVPGCYIISIVLFLGSFLVYGLIWLLYIVI